MGGGVFRGERGGAQRERGEWRKIKQRGKNSSLKLRSSAGQIFPSASFTHSVFFSLRAANKAAAVALLTGQPRPPRGATMREKFTADRCERGAELVDEAERRSGRSADDEASALLDTSQSTGLIQDLLRRRLTRPGRCSASVAAWRCDINWRRFIPRRYVMKELVFSPLAAFPPLFFRKTQSDFSKSLTKENCD